MQNRRRGSPEEYKNLRIKLLVNNLIYGDACKWDKLDEFDKDEWQPVLQELIRKSEDLTKIELMYSDPMLRDMVQAIRDDDFVIVDECSPLKPRTVVAGKEAASNDHGPITRINTTSASKRIYTHLKAYRKRYRSK